MEPSFSQTPPQPYQNQPNMPSEVTYNFEGVQTTTPQETIVAEQPSLQQEPVPQEAANDQHFDVLPQTPASPETIIEKNLKPSVSSKVLRPFRNVVTSVVMGAAALGAASPKDAEAGGYKVNIEAIKAGAIAAAVGLGSHHINQRAAAAGIPGEIRIINSQPIPVFNPNIRYSMQLTMEEGVQENMKRMGVTYNAKINSFVNSTNPRNVPIPLSSEGRTKSATFILAVNTDEVVSISGQAVVYENNNTNNTRIQNLLFTIKRLRDKNGDLTYVRDENGNLTNVTEMILK